MRIARPLLVHKEPRTIAVSLLMVTTHVWVALIIVAVATALRAASHL